MKRFRLLLAAIAMTLVIVVAFQNTEVVTIKFLAWQVSMSRFILLLLMTAGGFLAGFVARGFVRVIPK